MEKEDLLEDLGKVLKSVEKLKEKQDKIGKLRNITVKLRDTGGKGL